MTRKHLPHRLPVHREGLGPVALRVSALVLAFAAKASPGREQDSGQQGDAAHCNASIPP